MKKFLILFFTELVFVIVILMWFILNVQSLASRHIEEHITIAYGILLIGIISMVISALVKNFRSNPKWFAMPSLILILGIVSVIIAFLTPCCISG